jgi:hypothetical protein
MTTGLRRLSSGPRALVGAAAGVGLTLGLASAVVGASGLGGNIQIGFNNIAGQYSTVLQNTAAGGVGKRTLQLWNQATSGASMALYALSKSPTGPTISIWNTGGGTPARFVVSAPNIAPISTNGQGLVTNLNADKVDGMDASAFARRLWAVVDDDGTLLRDVGAATVTKGPAGYYVRFSSAVDQCAYSATIGKAGTTYTTPGDIVAGHSTANGDATHDVLVTIRNDAGAAVDRGFSLVVVC